MSPDQLLEHFDRISEAPGAIARLRRVILELAIRGKLVPQNENEKPFSDLDGKRIECDDDSQSLLPFTAPKNWRWLRLTELGTFTGGVTPSKANPRFWEGKVNWFSSKDIKADELVSSELKISDAAVAQTRLQVYPIGSLVIVARSGILKHTLPVSILRAPGTVNQDLKVLCPHAKGIERYLQIMLRGLNSFILKELVKTGTTVQSLKYEEFANQQFPLPPLAEQKRIVAKVDELMGLCDRLEAAQQEREALRDKASAASLARLSEPAEDAATFREHAQFHLTHLPRFTTHPDQIPQLRQTILSLAVRGKLVLQCSNDTPVNQLFNALEEVKQRLKTERKLRASGTVEFVEERFIPHEIPKTWRWVTFGSFLISRDGERIPVSKEERNQLKKTYDYYGASGVIDKIDRYIFDKPLLLIGEDGANLINRSTPIAFIARGQYWVNNHAHVLDGLSEDVLRFVELQINSIDLKPYVTGTAQPKMNQAKMNTIPLAIPPIEEQKRIVAKVDELMGLCDQLEASLATQQTENARLLEAILHEALAPT